eukprot:Nitzschia sp. Nitz4//scaffold7_size249615//72914//74456//NITZ4_001158-RA/size249615-augustus-gene-0.5-mRNA-1//1//CDS//3329558385//5804//frame0
MTMLRLAAIVALALAPQSQAFMQVAPAATFARLSQNTFEPLTGKVAPVVPQQSVRLSPEFKPLYLVPDDKKEVEAEGGGATVSALCFNLIKSIVGAGVLSLPSGIAKFADAPSGVVPAVGLISVIGALSAYGFALIGRVCAFTNAKSYKEAWSATMGPSTSWIPASAVTFKTFAAILAYSMILGDTFVSLLATFGIQMAKVPTLLGLTSTVLLPLCLLKNLSSLAPFSLIGSLGMMYTAAAMSFRYFGKSYAAPAGQFATDCAQHLQPSFGSLGASGALTPNVAILVGMLSTAYMAHFNAPKFYNELKEKSLSNYFKVVSTSFAASISIFSLIAGMGFLTFGKAASPLILNNYSNKDTIMSLSRIAVAISLVFSYPLAFVGFRDGVMDMMNLKPNPSTQNVLTVGLLSLVTTAALVIPDVSFVLAFGGSTLGNALIYVFPYLMFRKAIQNKPDATPGQKMEVNFAMGSAALGIAMGTLGAKMALASLK